MKRKFDELRENLEEFVEQHGYSMLLVGALPQELTYVAKFAESIESTYQEHYFLQFAHPFDNLVQYLDEVVEVLAAQISAAATGRVERGEAAWPEVPRELYDARLAPERRLRAILKFASQLLPDAAGHCMVIALLPFECSDPDAYSQLVLGAAAIDRAEEPWFERIRLVMYDDRSRRIATKTLAGNSVRHVLVCQVDFSTPALTDALARDAADPALPESERMACLLQLAAIDYGHKRYPAALEKYGILFQYYEREPSPAFQVMCLLGAGDTLLAAGEPRLAKQRLQQGIALALSSQQLPALLNLLLSITNLCMQLREYSEAESYADSGTQVAAALMNSTAYADLFEKRGDAQLEQKKLEQTIQSYKQCEELCRMYSYYERWTSVLEKQRDLFARAQMTRELQDAESALRAVSQQQSEEARQ